MAEGTGLSLPAFYGVKAGMTRIFDEAGNSVPVTIIKLIPNYISQVKTNDKDGYESYQVSYGEKREKLITKPKLGILKKAKVEKNLNKFAEVKLAEAVSEEKLGSVVSYDLFEKGVYIDVAGVTKGKGFQGVIKKFSFSGGPMSHGSHFHRTTGSIGNRATPGKVFKNKKMPGHLGCKNQTVQNLKVVELNREDGYLLVKGSIPGAKNGFVRVSKAVKRA